MADGSIEFSTTLDNSDLEKQLKEAEKLIESLKRKIEEKTTARNDIADQMKDAAREIESTQRRIEQLKARYEELSKSTDPADAAKRSILSAEIEKEYKLLEKQHDTADKLDDKWIQLTKELGNYESRLSDAKSRYVELGNEAQRQAAKQQSVFSRVSTGIRAQFAQIPNSVGAAMSALTTRINNAFKRMFLFGLILKGLSELRSAISNIVADNQQFNASVENLKAVMGGFLASMVNAVLPTLMTIVNVIAAAFERIASFIDSFFGTNILGSIQQQKALAGAVDSSEAAAGATNKQAKAAKKLAKEQEKANRQLMSFDEINALSAKDANDAADSPDYGGGGGGAGAGGSGGLGGLLNPDLGMFSAILDWLDEIRRRIETDIEGPFARIREGLGLIKKGIGEVAEGIMTGNWKLAWIGLGDIVIGILYVIEGAVNAFLDWLDETTGYKFHDIFAGLQGIVSGAVKVIEGLLRGDLGMVFDGIVEIVRGVAQTANGIVDAAIGFTKETFIHLFDYLAEKFPELAPIFETAKGAFVAVLDSIGAVLHSAIEGARQIIEGVLDIIVGIFTGDGERIMQGVEKVGSGIKTIGEGVWKAISIIWGAASGWFNQNVITPIKNAFSNAWNNLKNGAANAWRGIQSIFGNVANFFGTIFGNAWANVKNVFNRGGQIFNGVVNAITGAFKSLVNYLVDGINWAIRQPFNRLNGIIQALNGWSIMGTHPFSLGEIPVPQIPRLATGAVIPPNREFLAVLGDQRRGQNIEAPEDLIRQIVRDEAGKELASSLVTAMMQVLPLMQQQGQQGDVELALYIDSEELARCANKGNASLVRRGVAKPSVVFG